MKYRQVLLTLLLLMFTAKESTGLNLQLTPVVPPAGSTNPGPQIKVEWLLTRTYSIYELTWGTISYFSQEVYKDVGSRTFGSEVSHHLIDSGLHYDKQYKVCFTAIDKACIVSHTTCNYIKIPKNIKPKKARIFSASSPLIYLDIGPVHSKNLTVTWGIIPIDRDMYPRQDVGYQITWRRVHGRVDHPGHSSSIVGNMHTIRGLRPNARYELCVGETKAGEDGATCDVVTTQESIPGPPATIQGSCKNQAHGTHWKCDVSWYPPDQPNGRIKRYRIEWRDQEGYDLMESRPSGALCDPACYYEQIMNFHPFVVCVRAATDQGEGWESCVPIHDVSMRIVAFFELKIVLVIATTLLLYQLGPKILKVLIRCCLRGLYRHVEGEKEHPV